ncbi:hypothetical protein FRC0129_02147 [Corynebacterium diphtheriae]|nr:hypothetical protein CIP107549_02132 [Corynebacterium diphtheriae]CAB0761999.1 hypothetical protein FRC0129_02147 [Corynebacterium diphtheriae]
MALPVVACIDCVSDVGEDVLAALAHGFLGCLHVGHSLMGSMGSASMMVTITMFCGAADGVDDDISVGLHSRSLVVDGWFRHPYSYKAKDPNILCHPLPPAN